MRISDWSSDVCSSDLKGPGSRGTISIQPDECSVWDGNPRDQPGLTADGCRSLIDSIASEGGNRIPVLVRLNPPGSDRPYQLLEIGRASCRERVCQYV